MPLTSDQQKEIQEASRRVAISNIALVMVTVKKPKKDVTVEEVLAEAEQMYDDYFGS